MTVSNVVNGHHKKVSKDTIERINKLIIEMNYVPNASARILSTKRSKLIAMCIYDDGKKDISEDPYNSYIINSVSRDAQNSGYKVLLENESNPNNLINHLKSWNVAGAIFLGFTGKNLERIIQDITIPYVCLDCYPTSNEVITIGTNDFNAGKLAGKYLTSLGHENIAFASGPSITEKNSKDLNPLLYYRFEGFKTALAEEDNTFNEEYILKSEISYDAGVESGKQLALFSDVTAVFCTADILAVGIMEGLRLSGKKVPHDLSVLGFDNVPISRQINPKLSTINQQNALKGQTAIETLISLIALPNQFIESIQYDAALVERQTTLSIN